MKIIRSIVIFIFIFGIFSSQSLSEEFNKNVFVNIETPFYPIENTKTDIDFTIVNYGNTSFNGSLIYSVSGDDIYWPDSIVNFSLQPNSSFPVNKNIIPIYIGNYWIKASLIDLNSKHISTTQYPLNVHSFEELAVVLGAIIAILTLILTLIFKIFK